MNNQRKRLEYQSWHRGTKELDLLLGHFFEAHGTVLNPEEIDLYQQLLEEDDYDLYQWLTISTSVFPEKYKNLMQRIQAFHQAEHIMRSPI